MISHLFLTIPPPINCICNLSISFTSFSFCILENISKAWPVNISLTFRNLLCLLISSHIINQLIHKISFPKDALPFNIIPYGSFIYTIMHESSILSLCFPPPRGKLPQQPLCCNTRIGFLHACHSSVTTPSPSLRRLDYFGPDRIQHHISTDLKQMGLFLYKNGLVSSLKNMPYGIMPFIKTNCIDTV